MAKGEKFNHYPESIKLEAMINSFVSRILVMYLIAVFWVIILDLDTKPSMSVKPYRQPCVRV